MNRRGFFGAALGTLAALATSSAELLKKARKPEPLNPGLYSSMIQRIKISTKLGREQLYELGRRGPYYRYVNFPVEVRTEVSMI